MRRSLRHVPVGLVAVSLATLALAPRGAETVPLYAARNGFQCATCHFDPNGGGPRNEFGFGFGKNRHRVEAEAEGTPWADLALTNRVGDEFPLYFGLNQRFMALTNKLETDEGVDRAGFFNMENALHVAFQPHSRLSLAYSLVQTPFTGFQTKDAYGLIGLGGGLYLRAGQFRLPFGLRMDDHTVATRNGYLDFQSGGGPGPAFLDYDPRGVDQGFEVGAEHGGLFGRVALTNGRNDILFNPVASHAQAVTGKIGWAASAGQAAASFHDDFVYAQDATFLTSDLVGERRTRWGGYALTRVGPVALLGEVAAGTDLEQTGVATGDRANTNSLAWFGEADWSPVRPLNVRVRADRMVLDRSSDSAVRDDNTWSRWAVEAEWVPVPFAEVRATFRRIQPAKDRDRFGTERRDETQAYLQMHFYY